MCVAARGGHVRCRMCVYMCAARGLHACALPNVHVHVVREVYDQAIVGGAKIACTPLEGSKLAKDSVVPRQA